MNNETVEYKSTRQNPYGVIVPIVVFLPLFSYILYYLISNYKEIKGNEFIFYVYGLILMTWGIIFLINLIISFLRKAFFIEINQTELIGENLLKKKKSIPLLEIKSIKRDLFQNSMVVRSKNNKMVIAEQIGNYGDCIERITSRAVNVKEVNYRGIDKKPNIWRK